MMPALRIQILPLTALLAFAASTAYAQPPAYPDKPIRMVLPFPPGGGTDGLARVILPKMSQALGQPIVIDNRPGAGGVAAAEIVAKSTPDGHTLFMGSSTLVTATPSLLKLPYDSLRDFAPVTLFGTAAFILAVNPQVAATSVNQLVALAKAKPGSLNYASGGLGSPLHLCGELFKNRAGVNLVHIAYKGGAPAATAVIAGEAQVIFGSFAATLPLIRAGRLRALAVTSKARAAVTPELPTMMESGFPDYHVQAWSSFDAPARTPEAVVQRLYSETAKAAFLPDVVELMSRIGYAPANNTPRQYADLKRAETAMWARLIKEANIRGE